MEMRNIYIILLDNLKGRAVGRPRRSWEVVKMDLR
jgi:hypothetical protein